MTEADEVIDAIFSKLEAEAEFEPAAKALRELWAAASWEPERIVAAIAAEVKPQ